MNRCLREQLAETPARQELYRFDLGARGRPVGHSAVPSYIERAQQPGPRAHRQVLKPRKEKMRLDGESLIRSLHEVSPAYASDLVCHSTLIPVVAHVLDYGVREHDIETLREKLRHRASVTHRAYESLRRHWLVLDVEQCHANVERLIAHHQIPELLCSTDIEYLDVTFQGSQ